MAYDAAFVRRPLAAFFDLKGPHRAVSAWIKARADLPALPKQANRLNRTGDTWIGYVGPSHWLLRADLKHEEALEQSLAPAQAPPEISVVRISDTFATFGLTGPDAAHVVSIGCPLDLGDPAFDDNVVTQTGFFGLQALLLRCPGGFDVSVEQSYAAMTEDYLRRALR